MVIYYVAEKRKKRRSRSNNDAINTTYVVIANMCYFECRSRLVFDSILLSSMLNFLAIMCISISFPLFPFLPFPSFAYQTPSKNYHLWSIWQIFISFIFSSRYISSKSSNWLNLHNSIGIKKKVFKWSGTIAICFCLRGINRPVKEFAFSKKNFFFLILYLFYYLY